MSRLILVAAAFMILADAASGVVIHVPDDFPTIQDAIDASLSGDIVIVRPGTYVETIDFTGKNITVKSEKGPLVTVIDGDQAGSVVTFAGGEDPHAVLSGFTITNGFAGNSTPTPHGGAGIRCVGSSPTVAGNVITANACDWYIDGGGILCSDSDARILRNTVADNQGAYRGGGIFLSDGSNPLVEGNAISGNQTMSGYGIAEGAGIYCGSKSNPIIRGNVITENTVDFGNGGGILCDSSQPVITNNIITANTACVLAGGGLYCAGSSPEIVNNTVHLNTAGFEGGGLYCLNADPRVTNTILWDNRAPGGPEIRVSSGNPMVTYCDVKGSWPGTGNIDSDPLFADPAGGDVHLTWHSPCRDSGDDAAVKEQTDFEGDPRIVPGGADMGADEFFFHLYHRGDVYPGAPIDVKVVGIPAAPVIVFVGSGIQDPPYSTPHGSFWLNWPPVWSGTVGGVPGDGILVLPANVPCGWSAGERHPLQALVGPWGGARTRFTNPTVLTVAHDAVSYGYDDGTTEGALGFVSGGDMCWMHRFDTIPGGERIVNVQCIFGMALFPGQCPGNGTPCEVFVWDDPTNDGDPADCVLLTREAAAVRNVDLDIYNTIPLTDSVTVSGEFYIGCVLTHSAGQYAAPMDHSTPYVPGDAYYCGTNTPGGFDPRDLMNNMYPPAEFGSYWCLRAGGVPGS